MAPIDIWNEAQPFFGNSLSINYGNFVVLFRGFLLLWDYQGQDQGNEEGGWEVGRSDGTMYQIMAPNYFELG